MSYRLLSPKSATAHSLDQWSYRSLEGEINSLKNRTLTRLFNYYLSDKRMQILEAGCGFGAWCEWFAKKGIEAIGVEYYQEIVDKAKKIKPNISVEFGDVVDLKYPDNFFDAYVSLGVIEHFEKGSGKILKEAHRVLKPDGLAFISTPYLSVLRRFIVHPLRDLYFFIRKLLGKPNYFWEYRFTTKELEDNIRKAGFDIVQTNIDDYEAHDKEHHIGLWADWFFLRKAGGEIWELNKAGRIIHSIFRFLPMTWYCSGMVVVARAKK